MNLLAKTTVGMALCVLGCAACLADAQPPSAADAPTEQSVKQSAKFDGLLEQLGSPSFIQRDWAARRLMRQGADVVPPLVAAVRDTAEETTAAAAIALLTQMSRAADAALATTALTGLTALQDDPRGLSETMRRLIAEAFQEAIQHSLAQLAAFGAELVRDDEQHIIQISIHSERFTDRHMPLVGAFTSVQVLDLRGTALTGARLRHLASLAHLDRLNLTDTRITGAALRHLTVLPNLRQLSLYRIEVTADDINWLRENLPRCKVYR